MLSALTAWLGALFTAAFAAIWTLVTDAFVWLVDGVLSVVGGIIAAIPVPSFMAQGLGGLFTALDGGTMYLVTAAGLPAALAVIGAGFAFRLARKAATLFQW